MNVFKTYFMDVITKNYVNFEGRASRKQFWIFVLLLAIIAAVLNQLSIMDNFIGTLFWIVSILYSLAMILPVVGIGARRLHDTDRSGWWWLLYFLPVIGWIVLLVFWVLPSTPGQNRFGAAK